MSEQNPYLLYPDHQMDRRPRYYDGQFLKADDFNDVQRYEIDRRRRHLEATVRAGVVSGLDLTPAPDQITVSAGAAIDDIGRQIVLVEAQSKAIAAEDRGETLVLYIAWSETASDEAEGDEGTAGFTRFHELPAIGYVQSGAALPAHAVVLATVNIDADGNVELDTAARPRAGLRIPGPTPLTLTSDEADPGRATLAAALRVTVPDGTAHDPEAPALHVAGHARIAHGLVIGQDSATGYQGIANTGDELIVGGQLSAGDSAGAAIYKLGVGYPPPAQAEGTLIAQRVGVGRATVGPNLDLEVQGRAGFNSAVDVGGQLNVASATSLAGSLYVDGQVAVDSDTTLGGALTVDGNTAVRQSLDTHGNGTIRGRLLVGQTEATGYGGVVADTNDLVVSGQIAAGGAGGSTVYNLAVGTDAQANREGWLFVADRIGINTTDPARRLDVDGTARVTGETEIGGALSVAGALTAESTLTVEGRLTVSDGEGGGIRWLNDLYGGGGDWAGLRYWRPTDSGEDARLELGVGNDTADVLVLKQKNVDVVTLYNANVGVRVDQPTHQLHVDGNARVESRLTVADGGIGVTGDSTVTGTLTVTDRLTIAEGLDPDGGLYFPKNLWKNGQWAGLRYWRQGDSGDTTILELGTGPDADDIINFKQYGTDVMTLRNGKVGVGVANPSYKLQVDGGFSAGSVRSTGSANIEGAMTCNSTVRVNGTLAAYDVIDLGGRQEYRNIHAGKIGYNTFEVGQNRLEFVGGGSENNRRIKMYAEAGIDMTGDLMIRDAAAMVSYQQATRVAWGNCGAGKTVNYGDGIHYLDYWGGGFNWYRVHFRPDFASGTVPAVMVYPVREDGGNRIDPYIWNVTHASFDLRLLDTGTGRGTQAVFSVIAIGKR